MTLNPDNRYPIYHEVGTWLNENTKTSDKVGSLEVGIIGYYARRPMIDFAGLIQPQTAREMTPSSTYDDTAVWAVNEYHPQYIVFSSGGLPRLENDYIKSHCQIKKTFSGQDYHYTTDILVAECPN
jgi:hypothetical protein